MTDTLVVGRSVLTGDARIPIVADGAVLIRDGVIAEVGQLSELRPRYEPDLVIGGQDRIVMPGLVSAHQHGAGVSSVQLGCPDQRFERWLLKMLALPPLDPYLDTLYRAIRFIESGITSTVHSHYVRDWADSRTEVASILRAYRQSGLRVAFAPCFIERNVLAYGASDQMLQSVPTDAAAWLRGLLASVPTADHYCEWIRELRVEYHDPQRLRVLLGPVAPQWCSIESLQTMADSVGAQQGLHTHLLESPAQREYLDSWLGRSVVTVLDSLGLLGPATSVAHAVHARAPEIELLAARGVHVVTNPGCNLRLGNGIAPVAEFLEAGVSVAVGTDDMTVGDNDDLFAEGRLLTLLQRPRGLWLPAERVLRMLSGAGATAALFGDVTGLLAPGYRADVLLLDTERLDEPSTAPEASDLELVMTRATTQDIRMVLVNGTVMFCDGHHTWVDRSDAVSALRDVVRDQTHDVLHRHHAELSEDLATWHDFFSNTPESAT